MNNTEEWLIEFKDDSYFRLSENQFYIHNQKNYELCRDNEGNKKESYGGMKEMDFCYCHDTHVDLIECKEVSNMDKSNLKDDLRLKALHSSALLKTALYDGNNDIIKTLNSINKNYDPNIELKVYVIFKQFNAKDKIMIPYVVKEIENIIKRSLICPLGKLWNIKEVHVLDYNTAKNKLQYIK
ncbi:hypothetical protein [Brachyspira hyodysenteriae]|uniref:hypothetical protein n=1 Tax=Brachyspira hyodysenteriae TaxID=159 RepID=UPI00063D9065|nr:hypothetical protein [Brachyspira hyodysenteriae]KLI20591.1 hypothetical protein SU43_11995 [Brachyspira hyodysenteriae]KLI25189.1 hypothetical protein SR30_07325 [Brachyspira hyodysenteriae]KLI35272.1 hypothetical protein SZ50_04155 [Brachyspira hyodysenteriae]KLI55415.1 hypothetical protein SZ44_13295 [Brachyspira hyodysenteriae]TVL39317.1 hypothetical protein A9X84_03915 [Brachyspira hyodysenteriae]